MEWLLRLGTDLRDGILALVAILSFLVAAEVAILRGRYAWKSALRGFAFNLISIVAGAVTIALLSRLWGALGLKPFFVLHYDRWFAWAGGFGVAIACLLGLLTTDFSAYWLHRAQHTFLWRYHAVHHSIRDLHAANAYAHVSEAFFRYVLTIAPLSLIPYTAGEMPQIVAVLAAVSPIYIHSNMPLHLGPLRYLLVDNRYHRIHHSSAPAHHGRNFGIMFTVWDQLFGTAHFPARTEWPETGLREVDEPRTVREFLDLPWRFQRQNNAPAEVEA